MLCARIDKRGVNGKQHRRGSEENGVRLWQLGGEWSETVATRRRLAVATRRKME